MSISPGAHLATDGTTFAVRARDAQTVTLCLFENGYETQIPMQRAGDMHVAFVGGAGAGQQYGFRALGPWEPEKGLLFDPTKLLADPYATTLSGRFVFNPLLAMHGKDTAALVPKSVVTAPQAPLTALPPLFAPGGLIYELNARSFTLRHPDVSPQLRGTIAALGHPAIIAHLRKLHVAAVELMPVVAWIDERHLPPLGLRNAWGYNPVVPMALDPGLAPGGIAELRDTVAALRAAGIGVILDLVLNHTGESDLAGPTLSLRGLDNRCYARSEDGALINHTGTGNMLNAVDPVVRKLILDTLRHFVGSCGVDGFRFDLATALARAPNFDSHAPIFAAIAEDHLLADRVLIAEPWDVGAGGYQLGNFPQNWLEWNDRYRDDVRRFWRGDAGTTGVLATRMTGSSDIFDGTKSRGVSFIAAHDGFTLVDLVSFCQRHNDGNGEGNRDGHSENFSWNNGVEGPSTDPAVKQRRGTDVRALLATLFASRGTIQLTAGDEFGHSQGGNNNAYAQDNVTTWLDWENRDRVLEDFVVMLATTRAACPSLRDSEFLRDCDWRDIRGEPMTPEKWNAADAPGFELFLPTPEGGSVEVRIDRPARKCQIFPPQP